MVTPKNVPTGLVIWVCEGTKRNHRQVEMVNDNELLVKVFIEYLRSFAIDERRLRARVQCSAEDVMAEQIRWSKITGIPVTQFTKPIAKAHETIVRKSSNSQILIRVIKAAINFRRETFRTIAIILPLA